MKLQLVMNHLFYKVMLVVSLLVVNFHSYAFTLSLTIKGNDVIFDNAAQYAGDANQYFLTDWTNADNLLPVSQYQIRQIIVNGAESDGSITVSGIDGSSSKSFSVPIAVSGLQTNLGQNASSQISAIISGSACAIDDVNIPIVTLSDKGDEGASESCFSGSSIEFTSAQESQPFYFYRPGIYLLDDLAAVATAFTDAGIYTAGIYTGTVQTSIRYYTKLDNGVISQQFLPDESFTLHINYIPEVLTSITADVQEEIVVDYEGGKANGEAEFDITAKGMFIEGLRMTFVDKDYKLSNVTGTVDPDGDDDYTDNTLDTAEQIPYYIKCIPSDSHATCTDDSSNNLEDVVVDGALEAAAKNGVYYRKTDTTAVSELNFKFTVGIKDVEKDDVVSGISTYQDTFIVVFETIM